MLQLVFFLLSIIFTIVYIICFILVVVIQGIILSTKQNSTCFGQSPFNDDDDEIKTSVGRILPMEMIFALSIGIIQSFCLIAIIHSLRKSRNRKFFTFVKERFWYTFVWLFTFILFAIPTRFWIELGANKWQLLCKSYKSLFIAYMLQMIASLLVYFLALFYHTKVSKPSMTTKSFDNEVFVGNAPDFYAHTLSRSGQYVTNSAYPAETSVAIVTSRIPAGNVESPRLPGLKTFSQIDLSDDHETQLGEKEEDSVNDENSMKNDSISFISTMH